MAQIITQNADGKLEIRFTTQLDVETAEKLRESARANGRSIPGEIRFAITTHLTNQEK